MFFLLLLFLCLLFGVGDSVHLSVKYAMMKQLVVVGTIIMVILRVAVGYQFASGEEEHFWRWTEQTGIECPSVDPCNCSGLSCADEYYDVFVS